MFFKTHWVHLVVLYVQGYKTMHWNLDSCQGSASIKLWLSFSKQSFLSIDPHLVGRPSWLPCLFLLRFYMAFFHNSYVWSCTFSECMCASDLWLEDICFTVVIYFLCLLIIFPLVLQWWLLCLGQKGWDTNVQKIWLLIHMPMSTFFWQRSLNCIMNKTKYAQQMLLA